MRHDSSYHDPQTLILQHNFFNICQLSIGTDAFVFLWNVLIHYCFFLSCYDAGTVASCSINNTHKHVGMSSLSRVVVK